MNIEETKKAIEVMQAYVDGKAVQSRGKGYDKWWFTVAPVWDWKYAEYRIEPEPKELWVTEYEDGRCYVYESRLGAEMVSFAGARRTVRYHEVIEE